MISRITVLVCTMSMFACNLVDDEPPVTSTSATDTTNETGEESFTCTDWDPNGGVVAEGADRFLVDPGLVYRIADDGGLPLSECDGTKFRRTNGGHFMISKMASDGFLGLLGFAPGDVIEGIGDVELSGMDEIVQSVQGLLSDLPDQVVLRSRRKGVERFTTVVFE